MAFWQLTVPAAAETSDALTNFLWEQGALGVVEEEVPGIPPKLRAFFAAQMTAMDAATRNSADMLENLTLYMNKVRQAAITREIIEVVSGAQAL